MNMAYTPEEMRIASNEMAAGCGGNQTCCENAVSYAHVDPVDTAGNTWACVNGQWVQVGGGAIMPYIMLGGIALLVAGFWLAAKKKY